MKTQVTLAAIAFLAALPGNAAIVLSGNYVTGDPVPTLTITKDIVFTIATTGAVNRIMFDEWDATGGFWGHGVSATPTQNLAYTLSGASGPGPTVAIGHLLDHMSFPMGSVSDKDGYLDFGDVPVTSGDTFTIKAGSYTFATHPNWPAEYQDRVYTGEVFLADNSYNALTANVSLIPEPSVLLLSALGGVFLLRRKR